MKKLIGSSLSVSMIALVFAACTTTEAPRVASARRHRMPPAENVHQAQGGDLVLQLQQRGGQGNFESSGNAIGAIAGGH